MSAMEHDQMFMRMALSLAETAASLGEVPVGALIVKDGCVIASAFNLRERDQNPLRHAEMSVIDEAAKKLSAWRLIGCTLYVTLEPCLMCAGAIYQGRLDRVVYGATDPKAGAYGSAYQIHMDSRLNHKPAVTAGIMDEQSSLLLKQFFQKRRAN